MNFNAVYAIQAEQTFRSPKPEERRIRRISLSLRESTDAACFRPGECPVSRG